MILQDGQSICHCGTIVSQAPHCQRLARGAWVAASYQYSMWQLRISVYSRLHLLQSYTWQSVDLLWQPIELETLDILTMVHDVIADRVDSHKKLRQAVFLLRQSTS